MTNRDPIPCHVTGHEGLRIRLWDYGGEGPPILFAHFTGGVGRVWDPVIAGLRGAWRPYVADMRGHGDSGPPARPEEMHWDKMSADVLAVAAHIGAGEAGLFAVGHSGGASVLAQAELTAPGLLTRAVFIDPIIAPDGVLEMSDKALAASARRRTAAFTSRAAALERFAAKPPKKSWRRDVLEAYVVHGMTEAPDGGARLKCNPEHEAWAFEHHNAYQVFARLPELKAPVLLVTGSESDVKPLIAIQADLLPNAETHEMPGASHFLPQEYPEELAGLIEDWFQKG